MLKILMFGFLVFSSALGVEIVGDHIREMSSPTPTPTVMGVQSSRSSFPSPKPSARTIKQTTTIPKIDCTGPDGVVFKTTQKECDEFNAAWGKKTGGATTYRKNSTPSPSYNVTGGQYIYQGDVYGGYTPTNKDTDILCEAGGKYSYTSPETCDKLKANDIALQQELAAMQKSQYDYIYESNEIDNPCHYTGTDQEEKARQCPWIIQY